MKFDSFSEAFRYAVDQTGVDHVDFYSKIPMDKGQWSKVYNGETKNPLASTRKKLTDVVGVQIRKVDDSWMLEKQNQAQKSPDEQGQVKEPTTTHEFSEQEKRVSELVRKLDSDSTAPPSPDDVVRILEVAESLIRSAKELLKSSRDPSSGSDD